MTEWMREIERERKRAEHSQNPGRVRTAGRRMAGMALKEYFRSSHHDSSGEDFIRLLRTFAELSGIPAPVAGAARRLAGRISADFTSPSVDPLGDAMTIVEFVQGYAERNPLT